MTLAGSNTFSALIVSTIRKGNIVESIRYVPFFVSVSYVIYFMAVQLFSSIFGGLI